MKENVLFDWIMGGMIGLMMLGLAIGAVVAMADEFGLFDWISDWRNNRLAKRVRELEAMRRAHRAALNLYACRTNWIGSEWIGSEDPTEPARLATTARDPIKEIAALKPAKFKALS